MPTWRYFPDSNSIRLDFADGTSIDVYGPRAAVALNFTGRGSYWIGYGFNHNNPPRNSESAIASFGPNQSAETIHGIPSPVGTLHPNIVPNVIAAFDRAAKEGTLPPGGLTNPAVQEILETGKQLLQQYR